MKVPFSDLIQHFDGLATQSIEFSDDNFGVWDRDMHQEVLNFADLSDTSSLLELGCGTGRFTHLLGPVVQRAVAIDASPRMLQQARARDPKHPHVLWLNADMRTPPETTGIDTIVMCHAVRYLDKDERTQLFETLAGRLPVSGLLIIGDLLWSMPPDMVEGAEDWLDSKHAHVLMADKVEKELQSVGFDTFVKRMHPAISVIRAAKLPPQNSQSRG